MLRRIQKTMKQHITVQLLVQSHLEKGGMYNMQYPESVAKDKSLIS